MANNLLTPLMITNEAVDLWENSNAFVQNISRQYDSAYAVEGAKIGATLRIRLPSDYVLRTGAAASVQDTNQQSVTLTVATQQGVDMSFSSQDMTLSMQEFGPLYIEPAINVIAGGVATTIMTGSEGQMCNLVSNVDGSGNILTPTASTILQARALLANNSAPGGKRMLFVDPITNSRAVSFLAGLFNPATKISEQYTSGMVSNALGFDWYEDQTVIKHTTSTYSGSLTVNGANQTGNTLVVNAITGGLNVGDIITIAGVNAVNRITKATTGQARQFTITAAAASGATSLSIFPALIPPTLAGQQVQYQTVTASPANSAVITVGTPSASTFRRNFALIPQAVTMVTADLEMPPNVEASRLVKDSISIRYLQQFVGLNDQWVRRLDVLYGYLFPRPEWCVIIPDAI